jgi:hypothetical protein
MRTVEQNEHRDDNADDEQKKRSQEANRRLRTSVLELSPTSHG